MRGRRKLAIAAGVCFLITHVTSVAAPFLYGPLLDRPSDALGSGPSTRVLLGAFLEVILAMAIIGTAVALFPVARSFSEGLSLGYVGLRTLEGTIIAVGVLPLLVAVTLRQQVARAAGTDTVALVTLGKGLVDLHNWTLILGPGLVCGVNTVVMAYVMFTSRLVPRFIPVLGLIGGPLVFAYNTADMFGASRQILSWAGILVIPIFSWELSLALYLIIKGFRVTTITPKAERPASKELAPAA